MTYIDDRRAELAKKEKSALIDELINRDLNGLVSRYADADDGEDSEGLYGGKRVPYIGWFWRNVDFANGTFYIGDCGEFVGFMENNKWDYPERPLTPDEAAQVTAIICEAFRLSNEGGQLSQIIANTKEKLAELGPLLQTFPLQRDGFWIKGPQGIVAFAKTGEDADTLIGHLTSAAPMVGYSKVAT